MPLTSPVINILFLDTGFTAPSNFTSSVVLRQPDLT
jgi:hypothetical protein